LRQLHRHLNRLTAQLAILHTQAVARTRARGDRGANVVETIIIVAGFAVLAGAVLAAVSGKVHAWIAKMP
jgi:hypothetical protein